MTGSGMRQQQHDQILEAVQEYKCKWKKTNDIIGERESSMNNLSGKGRYVQVVYSQVRTRTYHLLPKVGAFHTRKTDISTGRLTHISLWA